MTRCHKQVAGGLRRAGAVECAAAPMMAVHRNQPHVAEIFELSSVPPITAAAGIAVDATVAAPTASTLASLINDFISISLLSVDQSMPERD